jgi:hypothetical protein
MVIIRCKDDAGRRRALGYLLGRFSFKSWTTGEMMIPDDAIAALAHERISFVVEGPADYEHYRPVEQCAPDIVVSGELIDRNAFPGRDGISCPPR